jgi:hypothetical protein
VRRGVTFLQEIARSRRASDLSICLRRQMIGGGCLLRFDSLASPGLSTLVPTLRALFAKFDTCLRLRHIALPVGQVRHRLFMAVGGLWQRVAEAAYDEG